MFRFCMEGDIDVALQKIAQSGSDPLLLSQRQGIRGRHEDLLGPLGLIHELGEGLGDVGQETDPIFSHQLIEKSFSDRWATQSSGQFNQRTQFGFFREHRRSDGVAQRSRLREGLSEPVQCRAGGLDAGGIKKFEQSFCVSTCDGCLNHNGLSATVNRVLIKREACVRWARQKARQVSIQKRVLSRSDAWGDRR